MLTLFSSRKFLIIASMLLAIGPSCRKNIDFDQGDDSYTTGTIDPSQPVLEEWEPFSSSITGVKHIGSDGQNIYYSRYAGGVNRMYKIDTSGNSSLLFDISVNDDVQLIEYTGSALYFTQRESNGVGKIHEFDETGILNTYELLVSASYGTFLTSIIDIGSELFIAGKFRFGSGNSWSTCLIEKSTGAVTQMPGLGSNQIKSATYFNNEIYIAGTALFGNYSSSTGRALAKWNGTQWEALGPYSFSYNYIGPLAGSCVGGHDGELFIGGRLDYFGTTIEKYSESNNNFIDDQGFRGTNSNVEYPNIQMRTFDNNLYAFGEVRFTNASFISVYTINNGVWRSIGALDGTATDLAICQGYAYAVVSDRIKKYPL